MVELVDLITPEVCLSIVLEPDFEAPVSRSVSDEQQVFVSGGKIEIVLKLYNETRIFEAGKKLWTAAWDRAPLAGKRNVAPL